MSHCFRSTTSDPLSLENGVEIDIHIENAAIMRVSSLGSVTIPYGVKASFHHFDHSNEAFRKPQTSACIAMISQNQAGLKKNVKEREKMATLMHFIASIMWDRRNCIPKVDAGQAVTGFFGDRMMFPGVIFVDGSYSTKKNNFQSGNKIAKNFV